jgi:hypothetical protein
MDPMRPEQGDGCSDAPRRLPLTMPAELWTRLAPHKRGMFESAQAILDSLGRAAVPLKELCRRLRRSVSSLLPALKLLRALELIEVGPGGTLRVIALPDEPLHVQGPDGRWRWIFVKRRLVTPGELERAVWH